MNISKSQRVFIHLCTRKSITNWEAITLYRATRLSAIIYNLRKKGHNIQSVTMYSKETGHPYAKYVLLKKK